jgi:mono/diheme cytochrome c family protein
MHDTPSYEAFEESDFFGDGRASRPRVEGTVARGELAADERAPVTLDLLRRGRQRYDIFCSPCHGRTGRGDGMVVRRGYRSPSSFHLERLRAQPDAYFFDVVTNGFGAMPSYAGQVPVADRWAIVAYLRALQLSQNVPAAELSEAARRELAGAAPAAAGTQVHR